MGAPVVTFYNPLTGRASPQPTKGSTCGVSNPPGKAKKSYTTGPGSEEVGGDDGSAIAISLDNSLSIKTMT